MWKLFQKKMLCDVVQHMDPVLKNELCTTGKALQNYETESFYEGAATPAIIPFRETFAP